MPETDQRLLRTYLNDHLAGATVGVELAKRARASNEGTPYGDFLTELAAQIEEDREELESLMKSLGISKDPVKPRLAWLGEKVGRLKPNGQLKGYSPLSRLVELEMLALGVTGKLALWRSMRQSLPEATKRTVDLDRLIERARRQRDQIERRRIRAAEEALG